MVDERRLALEEWDADSSGPVGGGLPAGGGIATDHTQPWIDKGRHRKKSGGSYYRSSARERRGAATAARTTTATRTRSVVKWYLKQRKLPIGGVTPQNGPPPQLPAPAAAPA